MATSISVLILTLDEELCLRRCLESVSWSDDIVVLDSFSTDATACISAGFEQVRFIRRAFDDFAAQRNHGLHGISYRHEFLFLIDADEICPPDLHVEMTRVVQTAPDDVSMYYVRRKLFFKDKWLRHNTAYPVWLGRLVRPDMVRYSGVVHERLHTTGRCARLAGHIHHYPFIKGLDNWMERRLRYSSLVRNLSPIDAPPSRKNENVDIAPVRRRRVMNSLYRRFPVRWFVYLAYNVVIRMCLLDGRYGLAYVLLETWYEYMASHKQSHSRPCRHDTRPAVKTTCEWESDPSLLVSSSSRSH